MGPCNQGQNNQTPDAACMQLKNRDSLITTLLYNQISVIQQINILFTEVYIAGEGPKTEMFDVVVV